MKSRTMVNCPTCAKPVEWTDENRYRPFCCERCKQIDLGAWAAGDYVVPGQPAEPLPDTPSEH